MITRGSCFGRDSERPRSFWVLSSEDNLNEYFALLSDPKGLRLLHLLYRHARVPKSFIQLVKILEIGGRTQVRARIRRDLAETHQC